MIRLIVIVAGLIAGLYSVDKFLAAEQQAEIQQDAERVFRAGEQLLKSGKPHEAATDFARAHALERSNRDYQLALADAQLTGGEADAARSTLGDLLDRDSNDARANLLMARALVVSRQFAGADSFYHRAIYGTWPDNSDARRASARLELADLLASRGAKEELLSELLLLQNSAPDPAREKKIAALFLKAGAAARAADAYHALIRKNPDDPDGFTGLARAEIMQGRYGLAVSAYRNPVKRNPGDASLRAEANMAEKLAELDPSSRRLSSAEKYRRSVEILHAVQACGNEEPFPAAKGKAVTNEMAEAVLENAERLWKARRETCQQPPEPFDPLPILMRKLAQ